MPIKLSSTTARTQPGSVPVHFSSQEKQQHRLICVRDYLRNTKHGPGISHLVVVDEMSLHFKINPSVYVDATSKGKARPVFFEVKPQINGFVSGAGSGLDNQLGNFMSKADGFPNHVPREAFTDKPEMVPKVRRIGAGMCRQNGQRYWWCVLHCLYLPFITPMYPLLP